MSAVVKVGSKMPANKEMNGLDAQQQDLVEDPKELRCALVWYDTGKITVDPDTGEQVPTIRLRRFEPVAVETVKSAIWETLQQAIQKRTGQPAIPLDIVEVTEDSEHHYSDTLPEGGDE